jgi:hypothetical protein
MARKDRNGLAGMSTLAALQLTLNRLPNELGAALALVENCVNAVKRALGKARRGLFVVDLFPAHVQRIDDITYCYKAKNKRYLLLQSPELMISSNHRNTGRQAMNYRAHVEGFTGHFATVDGLKVWAEGLNRQFNLSGKTLQVWKAVYVAKDGSGAQYAASPTREIVIGA